MNTGLHIDSDYFSLLEDNFLKHIGHEHITELCAGLDLEREKWGNLEIPEALDLRIRDFIKLEQKRRKKKERSVRFLRYSKRAAVILLLFVAANYVLITSVEAYRIRILNAFVSIKDKFTQIDFVDSKEEITEPIPETKTVYYYPAYIPAGFQLAKEHTLHKIVILNYQNSSGNSIIFQQLGLQSSIQVDSENGTVSRISINNDDEAVLIEKEDMVSVTWKQGEAAFFIQAQGVERSEILKMAESITPQ